MDHLVPLPSSTRGGHTSFLGHTVVTMRISTDEGRYSVVSPTLPPKTWGNELGGLRIVRGAGSPASAANHVFFFFKQTLTWIFFVVVNHAGFVKFYHE